MRVIAGAMKGRKIVSPPGLRVRPTSNKVKGALFNILGDAIVDASFLDLYAGTGAVGLEALSRGAARVLFVDAVAASCRDIRDHLETGGFLERGHVICGSASAFVQKGGMSPFDFIFIDPPYRSDEIETILPRLAASAMIGPSDLPGWSKAQSPDEDAGEAVVRFEGGRQKTGWVIVEHFHKKPMPEAVGDLRRSRVYRYGDTHLSFYARP